MNFLTYNNWKIDQQKCDTETSQLFSTLDKVFFCEGELIVKDKKSEVLKFSNGCNSYYIKRYTGSGRSSFGFFRKSLITSESKNLLALNEIGVPVPKIIAYGEKWKNGSFVSGALVTEEVEHTSNLARYLKLHSEVLENKKWLYSVIDQIALHVSTMHAKKFIHRDLNLRNVLVTTANEPSIFLIDCPAGGFRTGYFLQRGIIRDLAHLDKVARYCLTARELVRFYKKYKNISKLTKSDKKLIYKIRHFHDKHRARQNRKLNDAFRSI